MTKEESDSYSDKEQTFAPSASSLFPGIHSFDRLLLYSTRWFYTCPESIVQRPATGHAPFHNAGLLKLDTFEDGRLYQFFASLSGVGPAYPIIDTLEGIE